ncbi:MAG: peptidoglycan editing factor PgeF [Myxococcota bacterium]|nr:peptidoglycan editing factor PgeF [Myxococcota bacterium]
MYEQSELLSRVSGIKHGFSLRDGGASTGAYESLNLGFNTKDDTKLVTENLARLRAKAGLENEIFEVRQVHGDKIITQQGQLNRSIDADAIISTTPNNPIGVRTADCAPVLFAHVSSSDQCRANMIASVHAGWRGAVMGIAQKTLKRLITMGANLDSIKIAIGPCIGFAHFEVGAEVIDAAKKSLPKEKIPIREKQNGKFLFDLRAFIVLQLLSAGVEEASIDLVGGCTYSEPEKYFSYRRDNGKSGRHLSFISLCSV